MKRVAMVAMFLVAASPIIADCPMIEHIDDPPCTPCPFVPDGPELPRFAIWLDWSEIAWRVTRETNCDEVTRTVVVPGSVEIFCPETTCAALDSGWLP